MTMSGTGFGGSFTDTMTGGMGRSTFGQLSDAAMTFQDGSSPFPPAPPLPPSSNQLLELLPPLPNLAGPPPPPPLPEPHPEDWPLHELEGEPQRIGGFGPLAGMLGKAWLKTARRRLRMTQLAKDHCESIPKAPSCRSCGVTNTDPFVLERQGIWRKGAQLKTHLTGDLQEIIVLIQLLIIIVIIIIIMIMRIILPLIMIIITIIIVVIIIVLPNRRPAGAHRVLRAAPRLPAPQARREAVASLARAARGLRHPLHPLRHQPRPRGRREQVDDEQDEQDELGRVHGVGAGRGPWSWHRLIGRGPSRFIVELNKK